MKENNLGKKQLTTFSKKLELHISVKDLRLRTMENLRERRSLG